MNLFVRYKPILVWAATHPRIMHLYIIVEVKECKT